MEKDEILNMQVGRNLDAVIAPVIGWVILDKTAISPYEGRHSRHKGDDNWLPFFSESIEDAWSVVEAMRKKDFGFYLEWRQENSSEPLPWVLFSNDAHEMEFCCAAETVPLAICRAALLASIGGV